jgi:hypothetical protein
MLTTGSSGASCIQREHLEISLQINISCSTPGSGTHALLLYLTGIKKKLMILAFPYCTNLQLPLLKVNQDLYPVKIFSRANFNVRLYVQKEI